MSIAKNSVVTFHFTLKDKAAKVLESSIGNDPLVYLHGSGAIVPGLEEALNGRKAGEKFNVDLPPEKAYGERDERLVQRIPKTEFPDSQRLEVGMQFQVDTKGGPMILTITGLDGPDVVVDGNPELAGHTLHFDIEIAEVRAATEEELTHGHAHGPGGHHHHDH
jgi:FKBP-type peptidyl-prolyl cis-trans isomerase SlyD